jgi:hypothetical protein
MRYSGFLALLILAFTAQQAAGQELVIPDRQRLQAMSFEEYDAYREQMRNRMEGLGPAERNLMRESDVSGREQMERQSNGYGQGYGSRRGPGAEQGSMGGHGGYVRGGGGRRR